ncbi:MAG: ABC transporter permease subunit [Spirochaetia bacterium]|jgi:ABC-type sugar transport system permease subunit|nr:ABC transporter permease subunit [Spirochaetia bacterium]
MKSSILGSSRISWLSLIPLFLLVLTAGLLPFAAAGYESVFHDSWGVRSWAGLENFRALVEDRAFALSLGISLLWAFLSAGISVGIGFILACALFKARRSFKLLYAAILVPWGIPSFISIPIWRMIVHGSGGRSMLSALFGGEINLLTDPVAGFIAALTVDIWLGVPLVVLALYASLKSLDKGLFEAARIDGAEGWALARNIQAPLLKGTIGLMWALDFVKSFKEFSVPFLMTAGGPPFPGGITEKNIVGATTTLEIFLYDAFRNEADYGVASAYAVAVGILVILLVFLWFRFRKKILRAKGRITGTKIARSGLVQELLWKGGSFLVKLAAPLSAALVLYVLLWLSFSDLSAVFVDGLVPRFLSSRPYRTVLVEEGILGYFMNTLFAAGITALLIPLFSLPAALWLSRAGKAQSAKAFTFLEALGMAGGIHSLIPLFIIFRILGLLGGYTPVITVYLFHVLPFAVFSLKAYLDRLPASYEEAAALEGMGGFGYLKSILLPLCAPAVAAGMMAAFISAWNGFLVPLVFLSDDRLYTIGVKLHSYVGSVASGNPKWNLFAAASVINMLFVALLLWRFKKPLSRSDAEAGLF